MQDDRHACCNPSWRTTHATEGARCRRRTLRIYWDVGRTPSMGVDGELSKYWRIWVSTCSSFFYSTLWEAHFFVHETLPISATGNEHRTTLHDLGSLRNVPGVMNRGASTGAGRRRRRQEEEEEEEEEVTKEGVTFSFGSFFPGDMNHGVPTRAPCSRGFCVVPWVGLDAVVHHEGMFSQRASI